jgi:DedD protein
MDPEQDTEITLGTAKLLTLFFGLVVVCAVFFALGYTLGRKSDIGFTASSAATPLKPASNGLKPAGSASPQPAPPMTFYKAVEQKDANAQLTPPSSDANSAGTAAGQPASSPVTSAPTASSPGTSASGTTQPSQTGNPPDPMAPLPTSSYFVQVAAVTKQEDAESLVDALKKKQYPAFVATNSANEKLFRVQIGPFTDVKDAEATRSRLINDGYNPILKK